MMRHRPGWIQDGLQELLGHAGAGGLEEPAAGRDAARLDVRKKTWMREEFSVVDMKLKAKAMQRPAGGGNGGPSEPSGWAIAVMANDARTISRGPGAHGRALR